MHRIENKILFPMHFFWFLIKNSVAEYFANFKKIPAEFPHITARNSVFLGTAEFSLNFTLNLNRV
jgi:hypothetical protein